MIDPETGLDGVRWIGIRGRTIGAVSTEPLQGRTTIDAKGLVVAPGFIDLHEHGQDFEAYTFQARDGVTSTFELEVGTADVPGWYKARENKSAINHGVSIGHIQVRMKVMKDPGDFLPSGPGARETASADQIAEMKRLDGRGAASGRSGGGIRHGLYAGRDALGDFGNVPRGGEVSSLLPCPSPWRLHGILGGAGSRVWRRRSRPRRLRARRFM